MTSTVQYKTLVAKSGYVWVDAADWNVFEGVRVPVRRRDRPKLRQRPPWNGLDTPRLLLRPADVFAFISGFAPEGSGGIEVEKLVNLTGKDAALYRNFANLETTPMAIVEFANRYGTLWQNDFGIPFADWEYEIKTMRFLVESWDAADNKQIGLLAERFPKVGGRFQFPHFDMSLPCATDKHNHPDLPALPESATVHGIAREFVRFVVNMKLRVAAEYLQVEKIGVTEKGTSAAGFKLVVCPENLLTALWTQFADSIATDRRYRQCEVCREFMELTDVNRSDRRFCSDACRNRAMRKRQKLARQMRQQRCTLREISKATGSNIPTIKGWLNKTKG